MKSDLKKYFRIFGIVGVILAGWHLNEPMVLATDLGIAALGFGIAYGIDKK